MTTQPPDTSSAEQAVALKPCPFCGNPPSYQECAMYGAPHHLIRCCGVSIGKRTYAESSAAWNTRPQSDPQIVVTEAMVKAAQLKLWSLQGNQPVTDPRDMRAALEAAIRAVVPAQGEKK